jgi:hypothetical protein
LRDFSLKESDSSDLIDYRITFLSANTSSKCYLNDITGLPIEDSADTNQVIKSLRTRKKTSLKGVIIPWNMVRFHYHIEHKSGKEAVLVQTYNKIYYYTKDLDDD